MFTLRIQRILVLVGALGLVIVGYRTYGWPGLALVVGALVMWLLLHVTRMMQVLRKAANRPVGHVDSAVMLHARLAPGLPLLQVLALTRALGQPESPTDTQPECFRWTDASGASVWCAFQDGKLQRWELARTGLDGTP